MDSLYFDTLKDLNDCIEEYCKDCKPFPGRCSSDCILKKMQDIILKFLINNNGGVKNA